MKQIILLNGTYLEICERRVKEECVEQRMQASPKESKNHIDKASEIHIQGKTWLEEQMSIRP